MNSRQIIWNFLEAGKFDDLLPSLPPRKSCRNFTAFRRESKAYGNTKWLMKAGRPEDDPTRPEIVFDGSADPRWWIIAALHDFLLTIPVNDSPNPISSWMNLSPRPRNFHHANLFDWFAMMAERSSNDRRTRSVAHISILLTRDPVKATRNSKHHWIYIHGDRANDTDRESGVSNDGCVVVVNLDPGGSNRVYAR